MKYEQSYGAVIHDPEKNRFLLLKHRDGHWEFPKGKPESGESDEETMRREIKEETGLTVSRIIPFKRTTRYRYSRGGPIHKRVDFFLVECEGEIRLSKEHQDSKWMTFDEALGALRFENHRRLLRGANNTLKKLR